MDLVNKINGFRQLPADRLLALGLGALPSVTAAVLAIAIGWQATRLVWSLAPYPAPDTASLKSIQTGAARQNTSGVSDAGIDRLVNAHLFGEAAQDTGSPTVELLDPSAAPDTTLNLELLGTIASESPEESYALIFERGKDTKVYAIGDSLSRGTRLHAVYLDSVLLDRNGKLEALRLPKEDKNARGNPSRRASAVNRSQTLSSPTVANVIANTETKLTDILRPQPVFADGQQRGYRLYPGRERKKFAALGLRPGDLVTEINGTALNDPASGMEIFQSLGEATSVTVTVERDGQPEVLVLDTTALTALDDE